MKGRYEILHFPQKKPPTTENGQFAEFFKNATPKEKIKAFTRAAQLANEDQRKLLEEVAAR